MQSVKGLGDGVGRGLVWRGVRGSGVWGWEDWNSWNLPYLVANTYGLTLSHRLDIPNVNFLPSTCAEMMLGTSSPKSFQSIRLNQTKAYMTSWRDSVCVISRYGLIAPAPQTPHATPTAPEFSALTGGGLILLCGLGVKGLNFIKIGGISIFRGQNSLLGGLQ